MVTFNNDPNFSIVLPGGCNANCNFCFNKEQPDIKPIGIKDYLLNLKNWLQSLNKQFYQLSLTGGEPMISPYLEPLLGMLSGYRDKFTNILLTTNGTNILSKIDIISASVDHINISRHHYDEKMNNIVFGNGYSLSDKELENIIDKFGEIGIDVSVNCVINNSTDKDFILKYIQWAKQIGIYSVRFRMENGELKPALVEKEFDNYKIIWEGRCPVCRTVLKRIKGMDVYFKSSVLEPSKVIKDTIFELIYEPNGKVYQDWMLTKEVLLKNTKERVKEKRVVKNNNSNSTCNWSIKSCGGVSSSSCGGSQVGGNC